jgi:hypothetical protein
MLPVLLLVIRTVLAPFIKVLYSWAVMPSAADLSSFHKSLYPVKHHTLPSQ